jgi:hypothetical protein
VAAQKKEVNVTNVSLHDYFSKFAIQSSDESHRNNKMWKGQEGRLSTELSERV